MKMVKVGKWIAKHRILMLIIGFLLIIPSVIGMAATKVNYDLLSYLPEHLETVKGQDILVDEYGMGAFSMVVVENMEMKDVQKLEEKFEQVNHVKEVLWYDDVADISVPVEMIPEKLRKAFYNGDATMMLVLFDGRDRYAPGHSIFFHGNSPLPLFSSIPIGGVIERQHSQQQRHPQKHDAKTSQLPGHFPACCHQRDGQHKQHQHQHHAQGGMIFPECFHRLSPYPFMERQSICLFYTISPEM